MSWKLPNKGGSGGPGYTPANKDVLDALTDDAGKLQYKGIPIGTEITSLEASKVVESTLKQFVTAAQKSQIESSAAELASHSSRIAQLELAPPAVGEDQYVRMHATDPAGFLSDKIDGVTVQNNADKLTVVSLMGLSSTVHELNQMQGITGNVQAQINALTSVGNFTGSVPTYADIAIVFLTPQAGDMVIVVTDEMHMSESTIYVYNGTSWEFSGEFKATVRDFATQPIVLTSEVTGLLPKANYEKQSASETSVEDSANLFTGTNVEDVLKELFTFANSFKQSVVTSIGSPLVPADSRDDILAKVTTLKTELANAITAKGVPAFPYNTISEMATKVKSIPNTEVTGSVKQSSKINVVAPYTHSIVLNEALPLAGIAVTVLSYEGNTHGVVHYQVNYNNGDASNFTYDSKNVVFDGFMKLRDSWDYAISAVEPDVYYESEEIDFASYSDIQDVKVSVNGGSVSLNALKSSGQVVKASGDISLLGVESVDVIQSTAITSGGGIAKIAISFDSGVTWQAFNGTNWIAVDISSLPNFKANGMTAAALNALTDVNVAEARGKSDTVRFAYYLERSKFVDEAKNDALEITVSMQGHDEIANTNKYSYTYDPGTQTLAFKFTTSGTYTINYVDGDV